MTKNDRKKFAAMLADTFTIYNQNLSESVVGIWWNVLAGYKIDAVATALSWHVAHSEYCPRPANLVTILETTLPNIAWQQGAAARAQIYDKVGLIDTQIREAEASEFLAVASDVVSWAAKADRLREEKRGLMSSPEWQIAHRRLNTHEPDDAPRRGWLPPFIRRGLAAITGRP